MKQPYDITAIEICRCTAEKGTVSEAAASLYIAQPSLTKALKELEKEIGITIFFRSGRGVTLTDDGAEFLLYAKEICMQYEQLLQRYEGSGIRKEKFGVSTQHYSFAVKAFVDMVSGSDEKAHLSDIKAASWIHVCTSGKQDVCSRTGCRT